jgi:P27 family predicted phage terminase small subunit
MTTRGRKPTPTKLLELRGSWRAKTRKDEPQPSAKGATPTAPKLPCPAWLDDEGKQVWRTLIKQLGDMGILESIDALALGRYCQLYQRWRTAEEQIRARGETIDLYNAEGEVIGVGLSPFVKLANELAEKLLRLEQQYGMTASARASLGIMGHQKGKDGKGKDAGKDKGRFFRAG